MLTALDSSQPSFAQQLALHGAAHALLAVLQGHSDNVDLLRATCRALSPLLRSQPGIPSGVAVREGCASLMLMLRKHVGEADLAMLACGLLEFLCGEPANRLASAAMYGVPALVELMSHHLDRVDVVVAAMAALGSIAADPKLVTGSLAGTASFWPDSPLVIPACAAQLMAALSRHSDNAAAVKGVCTTLALMADASIIDASAAAAAGAVPALAAAMDRHVADATVLAPVLHATAACCDISDSPSRKKAQPWFALIGTRTLAALRRHRSHALVRRYGVQVLSACELTLEEARSAAEAGAPDAAAAAFRLCSDAGSRAAVAYYSCRALVRLALQSHGSDALRARLVAGGAVDTCCAAAEFGMGEAARGADDPSRFIAQTVSHAMFALRNMSQGSERVGALMCTPPRVDLMVQVLHRYGAGDINVFRSVVFILTQAPDSPKVGVDCLRGGVVQALLAALKPHVRDQESVAQTGNAISKMVQPLPGARSCSLASDILPAIVDDSPTGAHISTMVQALRVHGADPEVVCSLGLGLASLALNDRNLQALVELGAVEAVCDSFGKTGLAGESAAFGLMQFLSTLKAYSDTGADSGCERKPMLLLSAATGAHIGAALAAHGSSLAFVIAVTIVLTGQSGAGNAPFCATFARDGGAKALLEIALAPPPRTNTRECEVWALAHKLTIDLLQLPGTSGAFMQTRLAVHAISQLRKPASGDRAASMAAARARAFAPPKYFACMAIAGLALARQQR